MIMWLFSFIILLFFILNVDYFRVVIKYIEVIFIYVCLIKFNSLGLWVYELFNKCLLCIRQFFGYRYKVMIVKYVWFYVSYYYILC